MPTILLNENIEMRNVSMFVILLAVAGCGEPHNLGGPGVITVEIPREMWNRGFLGVELASDEHSIAIIQSTTPGGTADISGMLAGDRVISLDGVSVGSVGEFYSIAKTWKPNGNVTIELVRGDETLELHVTLMHIDEFIELRSRRFDDHAKKND